MSTIRQFILAAGILLAMAVTISCSSDDGGGGLAYDSLYDSRDDKTYGAVVIGGKTWMQDNLSYNASGSQCSNDAVLCFRHGRSYDWVTAMKVCPIGWHLPNYEEFRALANTLKEIIKDHGYRPSGFQMLDTGYYLWTSSETENDDESFYWDMPFLGGGNIEDGSLRRGNKSELMGIRCVKD